MLAGIIGYPLAHSLSPVFQQAAFDHCGIDARYERWETPAEALRDRVQSLRADGFLGANVTVPHKRLALGLVDNVDDLAGRIGAINTVVSRQGRLTGYNTDAPGFLRALREDGDLDPRGVRAFVIGAGGAARAIVFALAEAGAEVIVISNRTPGRAEDLARDVRATTGGPATVETAPWGSAPGDMTLVVNTTTLGMHHGGADEDTPLAAEALLGKPLVCDIVYNPAETPLLREARKAGTRGLGGLPMLVYQGAESFGLWTGQSAPVGAMFEAARRAL